MLIHFQQSNQLANSPRLISGQLPVGLGNPFEIVQIQLGFKRRWSHSRADNTTMHMQIGNGFRVERQKDKIKITGDQA